MDMDQLGHTQIATSMHLYAHILPEVRQDAAEKIAAYIGG